MKLSQFEFELPEKLIAEYPADQRDESRLMVVHRDSGKIEHKTFKDVINYTFENHFGFTSKSAHPLQEGENILVGKGLLN